MIFCQKTGDSLSIIMKNNLKFDNILLNFNNYLVSFTQGGLIIYV